MKITWIAQGGFIFEVDGARVVVDPYMSNDLIRLGHDRMIPVPISFADLKPDIVLFTHDHLDHYDPVTVSEIVKLYPDCKFLGPTSALKHHLSLGYDSKNFKRFDIGDSYSISTLKIIAVKAYHTEPFTIGLLISEADKLVYLSSDTLYDKSLANEILSNADKPINLAIVCINGRLGNMPWQDAAKLVEELSPQSAMPMHYGLFADNTQDPAPFVDKISKKAITPIVPKVGKAFII